MSSRLEGEVRERPVWVEDNRCWDWRMTDPA